jgi:hypothetical protein
MKFSHPKKRGKKEKRERERRGLHSMKGKGFHFI